MLDVELLIEGRVDNIGVGSVGCEAGEGMVGRCWGVELAKEW